MTLDLTTDLYGACQQISPRHPDYARLSIEDGFDWSSLLLPLREALPGSLPFRMATGGGSRPPPRARRPRLRGGARGGRPPPLLQRPSERARRMPVVLPLGGARAGQTGR